MSYCLQSKGAESRDVLHQHVPHQVPHLLLQGLADLPLDRVHDVRLDDLLQVPQLIHLHVYIYQELFQGRIKIKKSCKYYNEMCW